MTHYLQCTHCGHMNEMKSEYVVFCTSCGQKLENNFTNWQRRNPGGTFDEYKRQACFAENQLPPKVPLKKNRSLKSRSLKEKILIVAITTVFAGVGSWLGSSAVSSIRNNQKTDEKVLSEQWVKKTYGSYGLTLETPWELQPSQSLPVPQNVENVIEKMETFGNNNKSDDFAINVNTIKYKPELGEVNVYGGASGAINGLKNTPGASNFTYTQDEHSIGDLPGYILRGNYLHQGIEIEFVSIITGKDLVAWQVMVMGRKKDDVFCEMAERIIQSIQIDN